MSSAPKGYGWADCGGGERKLEAAYTPDMAAQIDGDDEQEQRTDFALAGELLHEIFAFAFAYRGDKPQPNLHVAFRRFVCIVWLTRRAPDLRRGATQGPLAQPGEKEAGRPSRNGRLPC